MADLQEVKIQSELSSSDKTAQLHGDHHLEDEKTPRESGFNRATLHIDSAAENGNENGVTFAGTATVRTINPGDPPSQNYSIQDQTFSNVRPKSAISRASTTSKTSFNINKFVADVILKKFFSLKPGAFETAVENVQKEVVKADLDGSVTGAWLLTQIDHWDNEKEAVVLLTNNSLIVVRYDFVSGKVTDHKRMLLHIIDAIQIGDLVYPENSLMEQRKCGGVRAWWNQGIAPSFGQKWNPFCKDIPWVTFAHHPAIYNDKERETITFNVDDFFSSLVQAVQQSYHQNNVGRECVVQECKIEMGSYLGVSSIVHNQSYLGYSCERGGVSF